MRFNCHRRGSAKNGANRLIMRFSRNFSGVGSQFLSFCFGMKGVDE
ncbi:hypothetical protein [Moraxella lacunata]